MEYIICDNCYTEFKPCDVWENNYGVFCECPFCGAYVEISEGDEDDLDEELEDQSEDW